MDHHQNGKFITSCDVHLGGRIYSATKQHIKTATIFYKPQCDETHRTASDTCNWKHIYILYFIKQLH